MNKLEERLRKLGVWAKFKKNLKKQHSVSSIEELSSRENFPISMFKNVDTCIVWSDTNEGLKFWVNINREIDRQLKEEKEKEN